jgi:hypothetical protein
MIEPPVCLWQIIVFFGKATVKFPDIDTSASATRRCSSALPVAAEVSVQ